MNWNQVLTLNWNWVVNITGISSEGLKKIIYLYYYRNEFIVADKNGLLSYRGHTIDTNSTAKLKVATLKDRHGYAMSSPSDVVNSNAAVYNNLLFVHSLVRGRYENDKLWKQSFIIDVYNLDTGAYLLSFPIYRTSKSPLNSFIVTDTNLFALTGRDLVVYDLKKIIKEKIRKE